VSVPAKVVLSFPYAPLAALMVLALVIGVARLMFTGTIRLGGGTSTTVAASGVRPGGSAAVRPAENTMADAAGSAVLVVAGWGSSCCNAANALRSAAPGLTVRQFSYAGLSASGQPLPSGPDADDVPLPALGDRIAVQVQALHAATHKPVDVVAESEGTLGVYAMLDRHPDMPVGSVVLLSPIIAPDQDGSAAAAGTPPVPEYALDELNDLVGSMSPYGPGGAARLLSSVGEFGATYFDHLASSAGAGVRYLAVVPLADALTLSACGLPSSPNVVVVPAFHGGLLGDATVLPMVAGFLTDGTVPAQAQAQQESGLRAAAELISGAAAAWRMPQTSPVCP
jgi:hypothetical protein